MTKHTVLKWIVDRMEDEDIEMVVKALVNTRLPHLYLARKPGPRKSKLIWKESTLEDARDMVAEIAKGRLEHEV